MSPLDRPAPEPPDRWLQEALRHAPDHDAAVPAPVRESILRAARGTVPSAAASPGFWQQLRLRWLRPQPLGYSGAFITLAVLGIWGLGGIDQQARQGPGDVASTVAMAPPPASSGADVSAAAEAANAVTAPPSTPPETAKATKAQARPRPATPLPDAAQWPVPAPSVERPRPPSPPVVAHADSTVPEQRMPGAAMPAPAPLPEPAMTVASESPAPPANAPMPAVAKVAPAARVDLASREVARTAAVLDPLGPLVRDLQPRAARSSAAAGLTGGAFEGQPAWLARLRAATAGRWSETADAPPDAPPLTVLGETATPAAIWLAKPGTVWARVDGRLYRAALEPAVMDTLATPR
jgi:hypothetical protein